MDEEDRLKERRRYQLCRAGFALIAVALVLASLQSILSFPMHFRARPFLPWLLRSAAWQWTDVPVVWGSLIGVYLLWGRWDDRSWQRRAGLLLVMCLADAWLWFLDHGADLGLRVGDVGSVWFRVHVGQALGWAEFALIAGLACDVMVHLGVPQAAETGRSTRSLAATGAGIWMLRFLIQTDWRQGWPLDFRRVLTVESLLLNLGWNLVWTITVIQVTALVIAATRQLNEVLREMAKEDEHLNDIAWFSNVEIAARGQK